MVIIMQKKTVDIRLFSTVKKLMGIHLNDTK